MPYHFSGLFVCFTSGGSFALQSRCGSVPLYAGQDTILLLIGQEPGFHKSPTNLYLCLCCPEVWIQNRLARNIKKAWNKPAI
ncbi:hypothetical protein BO78DRAFT_154962 [Aspergillus sclerotiicarbonarius CBS 121057]|uniref:Secreted protein n=1 Tax=Aspergillus sclerotiicarbonarius (strain CBS 121057 / IBT 28362) TaxID=1448318 RepID=A0A319EMK4_ASPSB|nr:hypothetical protein BO78DRAFT_154962 [Aspergillus sclerotiicarbonarius CBS 121057]